ncbi:MAG TPA: hypothetical protein VNN79_21585 [Actinomycetota bacterium]|nr:hypothetical protein [Actinomycetota bacterium]
MQQGTPVKGLHQVMRNALIVSAVILLLLGLDLTLFPRSTDRFFSWPIQPALTAGALGAFYLSAFVILWLTLSRGRTWARARVVLAGGIAFSALAFAATFIHLSKFNFSSPHTSAVVVTWVWTIAYGILTPILLIALIPERKLPGGDPVTGPVPRWFASSLLAYGVVFCVAAAFLYLIPGQVLKVWGWTLTPLTGRILGAWSMGFGLVMIAASRQRDRFAVYPAAVGLTVYGVFELLTTVRFWGDLHLGAPGAWLYLAFLVGAVAVGLTGASVTRSPEPSASAAPASDAPASPAFQP